MNFSRRALRVWSRRVEVDLHPLESAPIAAGPLEGVGVIVTRPQRQSAGLARKLVAIGARPLALKDHSVDLGKDCADRIQIEHEAKAFWDHGLVVKHRRDGA